MDTLPDMSTIYERVRNLKISNNEKLSDLFIDRFMKLNIIRNDEISRYNLIELAGVIRKMGEEDTIKLLEQNQSLPMEQILRKSDAYIKQRRRIFANNTYTLRIKKKISSIVKCPKCRSDEVETKTKQMRSADEPSTDINTCRTCNYKFYIT